MPAEVCQRKDVAAAVCADLAHHPGAQVEDTGRKSHRRLGVGGTLHAILLGARTQPRAHDGQRERFEEL